MPSQTLSPLRPLDLEVLRRRCSGTVTGPEDAGWDLARRAWNLAVDQRPAAVVAAATVEDVVATLAFAREAGLSVAPQATGHGASPLGSLEDSLLLKTTGLDDVEIDPVARRARVGAGALWAQVTRPASAHGLAPLAGSSPDVGVVGYTLGGGISWLSRRHGLACNHVTAIELVTADGRCVRADADHEPDLFWALRGGGGGFGVVTAMEFALLEAPELYGGSLMWPWERGAEVLRAWRDWTRTAPDAFTTSARLLQLPPVPSVPEPLRGRAFVVVDGVLMGGEAEGSELLAGLRALGPEMDTFAMVEPAALSHLHGDPEQPVPGISGHAMLADAGDALIEDIVRVAGPGSGSPLIGVELRHLGGALGRRAPGGGACPSLAPPFGLFAVGAPFDPALAARIRATLDALVAAAAPATVGAALNFAEGPTPPSAFHPPETLARLRAVKAAHDPDGLIRAAHPVEPAEGRR
jgi:FAD/FMN-containing dehydrogenase